MTVVKQEETVMDLKIPANIMDLQANQQPENAPNKETKVIPMNKDNYFYCRRCNINIKGCKEYYDHLRSEHHIKPNISRVRHVDIQPDIDDPNFYCRSCEKSHPDKPIYYTHLRRIHHMLLQPFKPKKSKALPDPYNPNFYCTVCKKEFVKSTFKRHLFLTHKMNLYDTKK
ncbi:hypothetical protein PS6_001829 [Mucor atramentarius]